MVETLFWFAMTLIAGFIPGILLMRTKIPMGGTIGAMIGSTVLNLLTEKAVFLPPVKVLIMILAGAMIGSKIGRQELRAARRLLPACVMVVVVMIAFNLGLGSLIFAFSNLDVATSLFAVMPGGGTEMAIVSEEMGANPAYVGILQIVRGILFLLIVPSVFSAIVTRLEKKGTVKYKTRARAVGQVEQQAASSGVDQTAPGYTGREKLMLAGLFASAGLGGMLFDFLHISAGTLIGGVLFGVIYSVLFGKARYPVKLLPLQQVLAGAYLGLSVTRQTIASIQDLLVPIGIMLVGIVLFSLLSGYIMCRITHMDLVTSFLAASPCGVAELALVSEELGADTSIVAIVQTIRFVAVVSTFPVMLSAVIRLFG